MPCLRSLRNQERKGQLQVEIVERPCTPSPEATRPHRGAGGHYHHHAHGGGGGFGQHSAAAAAAAARALAESEAAARESRARELVAEVASSIQAAERGDADVYRVAASLRAVVAELDHEFASASAPAVEPGGGSAHHSQPHPHGLAMLSAAARHLPALVAALRLEPEPLPTQGLPGLHPTVGSHRVFATEVLARVVASGLLPPESVGATSLAVKDALMLMLDRPWCNALHGAAVRLLMASLESEHEGLLGPLLLLGGPAAPGGGDDVPRFAERLVQEGEAACKCPIASRKGHVGHLMSVACSLRDAAAAAREAGADLGDGATPSQLQASSPCGRLLLRALALCPSWAAFVAEGGLLDALVSEQQGELCGPKPELLPRMMAGMGAVPMGGAFAGLGGLGDGMGSQARIAAFVFVGGGDIGTSPSSPPFVGFAHFKLLPFKVFVSSNALATRFISSRSASAAQAMSCLCCIRFAWGIRVTGPVRGFWALGYITD